MIERTNEEITAEIIALRTMKPTVKRRSMFGDDHHAAIDAQIAVLEEKMSFWKASYVYGEDGNDDFAFNVFDAANDAVNWLTDSEAVALSEGWKELVIS